VFAVACTSSGTVLLYDARNYDKAPFATVDIVEQCRKVDSQCLNKGWTKLEFSNDGKSLLVGTRGNGHFLLDAFEGTLKAYLQNIESSGECCFAPDGRYVLSGSKKDVLVWDTMAAPNDNKVLEPSWTLPDKREAAVLAFNPRYNFFATADQELLFWLPDPHA
jgi:COMPASS component SWD2